MFAKDFSFVHDVKFILLPGNVIMSALLYYIILYCPKGSASTLYRKIKKPVVTRLMLNQG